MNINNKIRIVQLIDSLEAGGAERMAVNYANLLYKQLGFSALITTREEGQLKKQINNNVLYQYLNRKHTFDIKALFLLKKVITQNNISHIHAHSSSVFFAVFLKFLCPRVQIVWHDHYGKSEMLNNRPKLILQIASLLISKIISVNENLRIWSRKNLFCKNVIYLPNFIGDTNDNVLHPTILHGEENKRIVCLANLRPQKNHFLLLEVAKEIKLSHPDYSFHLVGKDFFDDYSKSIKRKIVEFGLKNTVFVYGSKEDVSNILKQSSFGILTSLSEGLPIAILEYGFHNLPVVTTTVGEIPKVIGNKEGILVESNNVKDFVLALRSILNSSDLRASLVDNFYNKVINNYSENSVFKLYMNYINEK